MVRSNLWKAYGSPCCICDEIIHDNISMLEISSVQTKAVTYKGVKYKSKELFFHVKCYDSLLRKNKSSGILSSEESQV